MFVARFRTTDVSHELRFAAWHEMTSKALISTAVTSDSVDDFAATVSVLDLGAVQISTVAYPPLRATRTARLIRGSDPDLYYVTMPLRGKLGVSHVDREADVDSGHFVVIDTSRPGVVANQEPVEHLIVQVPRSELPKSRALSAVVARPLPIGKGMGSLMVNVARQLMHSAEEYRPADGKRLTTVVIDLVASTLAGHLDEDDTTRDAGQRLLKPRILDFIEKRLSDPALSPPAVAAAHNISVRYLHLLFRDQGLTVAGWIRERRLDRCRRDLRDAELSGRPVHAIGAHWGFPDATAFSRAFKQTFGVPPGDYRRQHAES
ncbi:helix-turn-helix domain-containing protein [Streptosporangium sp. 'caverna']|uniref:AraC-like ligand-binding domain-containing protein n=1 Tax=Streptosporangium sp. 'caverna' TaxID=2202249 RepID=UPI000D7D7C48|nr:helix-turn-helix domain-containing protein [Streptosporangium sp. 'caverna']AWS41624.1 AraC family transcriptional regulator [Streptosporangium sp. 'caverna']